MDKKIIFGIVGVLAIGGIVVGLGMAGIVKIPGLTPAKKAVAAKDDKKKDAPKTTATAPKADPAETESKKVQDSLAAVSGLDASKISVATDVDKKTVTVSGMLSDAAQVKQALVAAKKAAGKFAVVNGLMAPELDLDAGYKKIAAVWSEMKPAEVMPLMRGYTNTTELANILKRMDEDQVAKILALLAATPDPHSIPPPDSKEVDADHKLAIDLCKQLQIVASVPKSA